jgi:hypothetical protein
LKKSFALKMEENSALEIEETLGAQHGKETRRSKW